MIPIAVFLVPLALLLPSSVQNDGFIGIIFSPHVVEYSAQDPAVLQRIQVGIGDPVAAGDTLVILRSNTLTDQLQKERAGYKAAQALVAKAKTTSDQAVDVLRRMEAAGDAYSRRETEAARFDYLRAKADYDLSKASLDEAKIAVGIAEHRVQSLVIVATRSGIVSDSYHVAGELVSAGTSLIRTLGDENAWVRFAVPQAESQKVVAGIAIAVSGSAGGDIPGVVRHVSPEVDPAVGVLICEGSLSVGLDPVTLPVGSPCRVRLGGACRPVSGEASQE